VVGIVIKQGTFWAGVLSLGIFGLSAQADFGFDLGAYGGFGKQSDSNPTISKANMATQGLYAVPNYNLFPGFGVGPYFEYDQVSQRTDPAGIGKQNGSGAGYLAGAAVSIHLGIIYLIGGYSFLGKYDLTHKTSSGANSSLESPKGMNLIFGYSILPMVSADFSYSSVSYDVFTSTVKTSSDTRTWKDYRLGGSIHF
jgi:hypothetical protein